MKARFAIILGFVGAVTASAADFDPPAFYSKAFRATLTFAKKPRLRQFFRGKLEEKHGDFVRLRLANGEVVTLRNPDGEKIAKKSTLDVVVEDGVITDVVKSDGDAPDLFDEAAVGEFDVAKKKRVSHIKVENGVVTGLKGRTLALTRKDHLARFIDVPKDADLEGPNGSIKLKAIKPGAPVQVIDTDGSLRIRVGKAPKAKKKS